MTPKKAKKLLKLFNEFRSCIELSDDRLYLDMARVEDKLKQIAFPPAVESPSNWFQYLGNVALEQPKNGAITRTEGPRPVTRFNAAVEQIISGEMEADPDPLEE